MRRRPVAVAPRRGPSLLGTMATTAVVAGTATAVSKGVSNSMNASAQAKQQQAAANQAAIESQQQMAEMQAQMAAMQAQQAQQAAQQAQVAAPATPAAAPAAPAGISPEVIEQIKQLNELKAAGALTEEEFAAAKAKLLGQ